MRDLELKYLRNRMIVVVDCDGLKPEAIAHLMQGSRHQFFEGTVYSALESRVVATLKGDPDLRRLEEEAEDDSWRSSRLGRLDTRTSCGAWKRLIERYQKLSAERAAGESP